MTLNTSRNTKNVYYKNEDTVIRIDKYGLETKSYIKRPQSSVNYSRVSYMHTLIPVLWNGWR